MTQADAVAAEDPENLRAMAKGFNTMRGGYEKALANLRRYGIKLYVTFIFGYDQDTPATFAETVDFAKAHRFYIGAFNHLTPFPGTPLYRRLEENGRLLYDKWWLDDRYRYNMIPFQPQRMSPEELQRGCLEARRAFYSVPSILRRSVDKVNRPDFFMWRHFFLINGMIRAEVSARDYYPLGDAAWQGQLVKAQ